METSDNSPNTSDNNNSRETNVFNDSELREGFGGTVGSPTENLREGFGGTVGSPTEQDILNIIHHITIYDYVKMELQKLINDGLLEKRKKKIYLLEILPEMQPYWREMSLADMEIIWRQYIRKLRAKWLSWVDKKKKTIQNDNQLIYDDPEYILSLKKFGISYTGTTECIKLMRTL